MIVGSYYKYSVVVSKISSILPQSIPLMTMNTVQRSERPRIPLLWMLLWPALTAPVRHVTLLPSERDGLCGHSDGGVIVHCSV